MLIMTPFFYGKKEVIKRMVLFCKNCGKAYESCKSCDSRTTFFAWRTEFDNIKCFKDYIKKGGKIMRAHIKGKGYTIKEYDFKKGTYIASNDIVFKEEEIDTFILTKEDFEKLKKYKEPKAIAKKKVEGELDV